MAEKEVVTKELPSPKILWKAVQPRHYARAMERKRESREAHTAYVLSLVETFNGHLVGAPGLTTGEIPVGAVILNATETRQVLADFEAKFGGKGDSV